MPELKTRTEFAVCRTVGIALLLAALVTSVSCRRGGSVEGNFTSVGNARLTYNRDIAPIIFLRCAACHRPGEAGPFDLLTYVDVASRAKQIVEVTQSRYMPPWPPETGHRPFRDERRLSSSELEKIVAWVEAGAVEGDAHDLPPLPQWTDGWQLGEPDLVLEMDTAYEVRAEGSDIFRNFVVPVELAEDRYVAAFEFRPGNPRVVHHADIRTDDTGGSRELDTLDVEPGFDGIFGGSALTPGGVFLGWTPGRVPDPPSPKVAWPLRNGIDMIFQLHLQPTGKPESIRSSLGVYFADGPPILYPYAISIGCRFFDIPPGIQDYTVERSYAIPVDSQVVSVYPHAHYLANHVHGWAELPDGQTKTLIEIKDWDFNWQDQYAYQDPLHLPAGTTVTMRYIYDNSAENPRNPHHPPQRVVYGPRSANEMGELMLQLVLGSYEEFAQLDADNGSYQVRGLISDYEKTLAIDPNNVIALHELGALHSMHSEPEQAAEYFSRELELREDGPSRAKAWMYLALTFHQRGMAKDAEQALQNATKMEPELVRAWFALGDLLNGQSRYDEAVANYQRGLGRDPHNVKVLNKVGLIYLQVKDLPRATQTYRQVLEIEPKHFDAHFNLGNLLFMQRQAEQAVEHYQAAIRLRPEVGQAHKQLGLIHAMQQDYTKAAESFEKALAIDDSMADAHYNLGMVREQQGRDAEAVRHYRHRLAAPRPSLQVALRLAWLLATSPDDTVRQPEEAVALAEKCAEATRRQDPLVLDLLAAAHAASGDYQLAATNAEQARKVAMELQQQQLATQIEARLQLYRQELPYRRAPRQ